MTGERLSRRQIARYASFEIIMNENKAEVLSRIAAYLIESSRTNEIDLVVRAIEQELADHGDTVADITTAHPLNEGARRELTQFITESSGAERVYIREHVDASVIGGVTMRYDGREIDTTIKAKLKKLLTQK